MEVVSLGFKIKFQSLPPPRYLLSNLHLSLQHLVDLQQAIAVLLDQGVIVPVSSLESFRGFFSNLFTVLKNYDVCLILDMKALNAFFKGPQVLNRVHSLCGDFSAAG